MICHTLFSGSSGNSIFVKEKNTAILIDAGKSIKQISLELQKIGSSLDEISAVFVTHEHTDHTKSIGMIAEKLNIPIYCQNEVAKEIYYSAIKHERFEEAASLAKCIRTIEVGNVYESGDIEISPFQTPHDSNDSCGYVIGDNVLGIATDLGHITDEVRKNLTKCKNVILESNYDSEMLKNGSYPPYLKERILSENGHLDNVMCADFSTELLRSGCENLVLFHISKDNNTHELARKTTEERLNLSGATVGCDILLSCAPRDGEMKVL